MAKLNQILPSKKENCVDYEYYKERVKFKIEMNNYIMMDRELEELLKVFYDLPSEEYETIRKKHNYDFLLYRHNISSITNLLKESKDKVNDLGILLEIIMIKDDVIRKIVANSYPLTLTSDQMEEVTNGLLHQGKGIELFNGQFKTRTLEYQNNPLFSKYINSYTDEKILEELTKACKNRLRKQLTFENKEKEYHYNAYSYKVKSAEIKKRHDARG